LPDIYYPRILRDTAADVFLFYINIKNAFYNFFLFILEAIKFYPDKLLRQVDIELFKTYAVKDQFTVSQEEGKKLFDLGPEELTYGEATWRSINKIMEFIKPARGNIFYDLGCGTGRICFFNNIYYGLETYGIDLIPTFIANAHKIVDKFALKNINFYQDNWLNRDISNADILYIAGTCLDENTIYELIQKLKTLKSGAFVISVSNPLKADFLEQVKVMNLPFSWGKAEVFVLKVV
jgi:SAM-dependent methyltransferase